MCGIVGGFDLAGSRVLPERLLVRMRDTLAHRGPDGAGALVGPGYALGHRRLAIVDLAGGAQPLCDGEGRALIANGEIYNHRALRERLEAHGRRFRTRSDSEAILHAHAVWGDDATAQLHGMFAYAWLDPARRRLVLARDRLGVKPLYWTRVDEWLLFASEPKALLAHPAVSARLDPAAVRSFLSFRYVLGSGTFFEGIHALEPGQRLVATPGRVALSRHWELPAAPCRDVGPRRAVAEVRERLAAAVEARSVADVPVGAFLSGGVDSSAIVALMSKRRGPVATFTTGFEQDGYHEHAYAEEVAARYRADHHRVATDPGAYVDAMRALIHFKDAPLGVPNEVPLWWMSQALSAKVKVVLSGEGADELYGGYGRIFRAADDYLRHRVGGSPQFERAFAARYGPVRFSSAADFFLARYRYFGRDAERWLAPDFARAAAPRGEEVLRDAFERVRALPLARQFLWVFQRHHLPGLLGRLDATTMAASVEGRVPFTDHAMVEHGQRLPASIRLRWRSASAERAAAHRVADDVSETLDVPKWVLKEACRPLLPARVIDRRKMGFPVPLGAWMQGALGARAREVLLDDATTRRGLFDRRRVERALRTEAARWQDGMRIWMLLSLELFCRQAFDAPRSQADAA